MFRAGGTVEALDLAAAAFTGTQTVGFNCEATIALPGCPYTSAALTWDGDQAVLSIWSSAADADADLAMYWRLSAEGGPRLIVYGIPDSMRRPRVSRPVGA